MKFIKLLIALVPILIVNSALAQSLADELLSNSNNQNSTSNNNDPLSKNYIVNKNFANFKQVVSTLNSIGITGNIKSQQANEPTNQFIKTSTNVRDFISTASQKFGYSWENKNNTIIFTATNPIKSKITASAGISTPKTTISQNTSNSKIKISPIWKYSTSDQYISNTLNKWASTAGYQLEWKTSDDFQVQASGEIKGTFKQAVNEVLKSFKHSDHPLKALWYENNVVVVTNLGD